MLTAGLLHTCYQSISHTRSLMVFRTCCSNVLDVLSTGLAVPPGWSSILHTRSLTVFRTFHSSVLHVLSARLAVPLGLFKYLAHTLPDGPSYILIQYLAHTLTDGLAVPLGLFNPFPFVRTRSYLRELSGLCIGGDAMEGFTGMHYILCVS